MVRPGFETVLAHLRVIQASKRAMLQVAVAVEAEHPDQAHLLLRTIRGMTRSADSLLGDTMVAGV